MRWADKVYCKENGNSNAIQIKMIQLTKKILQDLDTNYEEREQITV